MSAGPIWDTKMLEYLPGTRGTDVVHRFLTTGKGNQSLTKWVAGGTAEVSQGHWESNHGGGYQFRLCKASDFSSDGQKNEECFQRSPLDYASDQSWIQYDVHGESTKNKKKIAFPAIRVNDQNTKGIKPAGMSFAYKRRWFVLCLSLPLPASPCLSLPLSDTLCL